jgi:uncharacterized NAD-dependent epimerase/dehydratase family protein
MLAMRPTPSESEAAAALAAARRLLILTEGMLGVFTAKTATCLLRYRPHDVVGLLDSVAAGASTRAVLGVDVERPVLATLAEALALRPDALVIGIAPRGGGLPPAWRAIVRDAVDAGLHVLSGLHTMLAGDAELRALARRRGVALVDLRQPPAGLRLPPEPGARAPRAARVVLTVGSDCNVGKMTASAEIVRAAGRRGLDAVMAATGQTGMLIAGGGIAVDRVPSDFVAGATDMLIERAGVRDWIVVEGQGALAHPAYSGVTLGLLHGARPDALVICHHVGREAIRGYDVPIPGPKALCGRYETAAGWCAPTRVVAVALNGHGAAPEAVAACVERVRRETGLVAVDPLADADRLVTAIATALGD